MSSSLLLSSSVFFSCSSFTCVCSSFFSFVIFPVSFFFFINRISVLSFALSVGEVNSTTAVFLFLLMGLMASENLTQAWYSGVLSVNPISFINEFKLGLVPVSGLTGGKSISNYSIAFVSRFVSFIVLIGFGLLSAFVSVDFRLGVDFLVGMTKFDGVVLFLLSRLCE